MHKDSADGHAFGRSGDAGPVQPVFQAQTAVLASAAVRDHREHEERSEEMHAGIETDAGTGTAYISGAGAEDVDGFVDGEEVAGEGEGEAGEAGEEFAAVAQHLYETTGSPPKARLTPPSPTTS